MKRHEHMVRPASPGAIIQKALADSGRDAEWLRKQLGWRKRFFRDVMEGRELLGLLDALEIGRVLNRSDLKLISAQCACEAWDDGERRLAKERGL